MNAIEAQNILNGMAITKMEITLNCLRNAEVTKLNVKLGGKRYEGCEVLANTLNEGLEEEDAMICLRNCASKALRDLRDAGGVVTIAVTQGCLSIWSGSCNSSVSIELDD